VAWPTGVLWEEGGARGERRSEGGDRRGWRQRSRHSRLACRRGSFDGKDLVGAGGQGKSMTWERGRIADRMGWGKRGEWARKDRKGLSFDGHDGR